MKYNEIVGAARVENFDWILTNLGFKVISMAVQNRDVDLWVFSRNQLILVAEITNWRDTSIMSRKKARSFRFNFTNYDCHKLLVVSFLSNIGVYRDYVDEDVDVLEMGFQTQPFYGYNAELTSEGMNPHDDTTRLEVIRLVTNYLISKGLIVRRT